jgi:hypothetical protein
MVVDPNWLLSNIEIQQERQEAMVGAADPYPNSRLTASPLSF